MSVSKRLRFWDWRAAGLCVLLLLLGERSGVWDQLFFQKPFRAFRWPLDVDVRRQVLLLLQGRVPDVRPIPRPPLPLLHTPLGPAQPTHLPTIHILVTSAASNSARRRAVRGSWGGVAEVGGWALRRTFLLGRAREPAEEAAVEEEAGEWGDCLVGAFRDSYLNLTRKTLLGLDWLASDAAGPYAFALFIDDDTFLNPYALVRLAQQLQKEAAEKAAQEETEDSTLGQLVWTGSLMEDAWANRIRLCKNHLSLEDYPFAAFHPFIAGNAYLVSADFARAARLAARFVRLVPLEDAYLGILAHRLGVRPRHDHRFVLCTRSDADKPFHLSNVVTVQGLGSSTEELQEALAAAADPAAAPRFACRSLQAYLWPISHC